MRLLIFKIPNTSCKNVSSCLLHIGVVALVVGDNMAGKRDVMKLLVVAVALLVVAVNSESDECGPQERVKVKRQWNEMFCGDISERMQLGQDIYNTCVQFSFYSGTVHFLTRDYSL